MSETLESLKTLLASYLVDLDGVEARMLGFFEKQQFELSGTEAQNQPAGSLEGLSAPEELRTLVARREELLKLAQSNGMAVKTLAELGARVDDSEGSLARSIRLLKQKMEAMHYASLSHWISCQKSWLHYSQLVQLIANGGRKPLMPGNSRSGIQGGVILDAKV